MPSSSSEWDYEWDYTKGLLNANDNGFSKITSGGSVAITNNYLEFKGKSSSYTSYAMSTGYSTGVMEAELWSYSNAQMQMRFGNGEYGIGIRLQTSTNYKGVYLGTGLDTKLKNAVASTKYTIRLVLKGEKADVYVNNELVLNNEDVTALTDCDKIYIAGLASASTNQPSRLYSLKMKFGRT